MTARGKKDARHFIQAFLTAYLAKNPSKWGTLNLDRQNWFWIGYDYADARQKGWHPKPPEPAPGTAPIR